MSLPRLEGPDAARAAVRPDRRGADRPRPPPPFSGLAANLNAYAQAGATHPHRPELPQQLQTHQVGTTLLLHAITGEQPCALSMYDDGPDPTPTSTAHPWAGRGGWLGAGPGTSSSSCSASAAPALMGVGSGPSTTPALLRRDGHSEQSIFTWAQEAPLLPVGRVPLQHKLWLRSSPGRTRRPAVQLSRCPERAWNIAAVRTGKQPGVLAEHHHLQPGARGKLQRGGDLHAPSVGAFTATVAVTGRTGTTQTCCCIGWRARLPPRRRRRRHLQLRRRLLRRLDGRPACAPKLRIGWAWERPRSSRLWMVASDSSMVDCGGAG